MTTDFSHLIPSASETAAIRHELARMDPPEHTHALADTFKASWDYDTLPKPLNGWAIEDAMFAWDDDDECWVLHSIEEASFCGGDTPYNLTPRQIDALFFPGAGAPILADLLEGLAEDKWRAQQ